MIGALHPLHIHVRSMSYIYNVFQHLLLLWLVALGMQPHNDICWVSQWRRQEILSAIDRFLICSMMWVMIEACHWIHTHIRSLLYIYIVFQHLLLWLVVIWMQPQHMLSLTHTQWWQKVIWSVPYCIMLWVMIEAPHPDHTHSRSSLYIFMCFNTSQPQPDIAWVSKWKVEV